MELEETNVELQADLDTAHAKVAEVEGRERVLKSNYNSLRSDYGNIESIFTKLQQETTDSEKA
jgi:hypothetical protein